MAGERKLSFEESYSNILSPNNPSSLHHRGTSNSPTFQVANLRTTTVTLAFTGRKVRQRMANTASQLRAQQAGQSAASPGDDLSRPI